VVSFERARRDETEKAVSRAEAGAMKLQNRQEGVHTLVDEKRTAVERLSPAVRACMEKPAQRRRAQAEREREVDGWVRREAAQQVHRSYISVVTYRCS